MSWVTSRLAPLRAFYVISSGGPVRSPRWCYVAKWLQSRHLHTGLDPEAVPYRKHLKDEAKRRKAEAKVVRNANEGKIGQEIDARLEKWELTVGIEIHAELNTTRKLFSSAPTSLNDENADNGLPNSQVALFDAAMPGSQPQFQRATLLPAVRAAIALGCEVQRKSGWDRKHYFHWDQPNGYQITQYYAPFAKNGMIQVTTDDGVPEADVGGAECLSVGIKQIQMEQDTAKTTAHGSSYHIDLNRTGHPLIEIITLPQIHSPQAASAVVRKIQGILKAIDACTTGMELGGLRADVNVSVRQRGTVGSSSYSGVSGLGQRTEIKNLSSFKAVEDAIIAERDRQIAVLEAGGVIQGETRGWNLGDSETRRLRGKEGEVDYRYMPDADLPPLFIGADLVDHLRSTLPELPDQTVSRIHQRYGLSMKDARTLISLDEGDRLEFMEETVSLVMDDIPEPPEQQIGKVVGNWLLMEIGGLLNSTSTAWADAKITPREVADVFIHQQNREITSRAAKQLLATLVSTTESIRPEVHEIIDRDGLRLRGLSDSAYRDLAISIMGENPEMVKAIIEKGQKGKTMWLVGQMVRRSGEGTVEPERAREVVEKLLLEHER